MAEPTGLFLADAEENDTAEWTAVSSAAGNSLAASAAALLHGSYGFDLHWGGTNTDNYAYKTLASAYHTIYARCYVNFNSITTGDVKAVTQFSLTKSGSSERAKIQFYSRGSGQSLGVRFYLDGVSVYNQYNVATFAIGTTYYVEILWKDETGGGVGAGGGQFWIDGVSQFSDFTKSNGTGSVDRVFIGNNGLDLNSNLTVIYYDDIKLDTAYIGEYPAAGGVALAGSVSGVSTTSALLPYIDHYLVNNTIVGQSSVSQVLPYIDHYLVNNSIVEQSSVSQVLPYIYHYLVDNAVAGASDLVGNLTVILAQIYQYLAGAVEAVSSLPAILPYIYHTLVNNVVEGVSDLVGNLTVIAGSVASRLRIYMRIGGGRF